MGENEIGGGGQDPKAPGLQRLRGPGPVVPHGPAAGLEVLLILHGGGPRQQGEAVDVIGVEAVLHPVQVRDQLRRAQGEADAPPRQGAALGHGLRHQEIVILPDQGDAALRTEVHIRLVHNDHPVPVLFQQPPDLRDGNRHARGGVGIGDDHSAGKVQIVLHVQGEVLPQGDPPGLQAEQGRLGFVEAICNVRKGRALPLPAEGPEGKGQNLVGAVAGNHVLRGQAVPFGNGGVQSGAGGVGVEIELFRLRPGDGLQHLRRGREGAFVGVQFNVLLVPGLLAGGVGGQATGLRG